MLIIDSHLDLAWNALQWNRDITQSAYTIRTQEAGIVGPGRGAGTVALPELRHGRVAVSFATLLARSTGQTKEHIDYASPTQAYGIARGQLAYYRALADQNQIRLILTLNDLNDHIAAWEKWEAAPQTDRPTPGVIISMESADPIQDPKELADWHQAGVRVIGPAHYGPGRYAGGTGTESGLTGIGVALVKEMERLGVILDLTHLSDQAFWQALKIYAGPVLASHNNCRALVPHQRQFDDQQLKAIIERDGVIGAAFDNWMIRPGWIHETGNQPVVTMAHVVDHIDHICQLAGNCLHVGIGSDLDGGFGREQSPQDLDTIADLQKLPALLAQHGYSEVDIAGILNRNWLRLLRKNII
jgi:membrane dipeptidase